MRDKGGGILAILRIALPALQQKSWSRQGSVDSARYRVARTIAQGVHSTKRRVLGRGIHIARKRSIEIREALTLGVHVRPVLADDLAAIVDSRGRRGRSARGLKFGIAATIFHESVIVCPVIIQSHNRARIIYCQWIRVDGSGKLDGCDGGSFHLESCDRPAEKRIVGSHDDSLVVNTGGRRVCRSGHVQRSRLPVL